MLQTSRYLNGGSPLACVNCREPFAIENNHFRAWHGKDKRYYCSEDCEQHVLEARKVLS